MTLRPEDRSLAAYLLERDAVPMDELFSALADARTSERDLGEALVRQGTLDAPAVVAFRAEAMKTAATGPSGPALVPVNDASERSTVADARIDSGGFGAGEDTWFDLVGEAKPAEGGLEAELARHTPKEPPAAKNEWDDLEPTRIPQGADEWDGLGPTRPYEPGRHPVAGDVLDSDTIRGGSAFDPVVGVPKQPYVVEDGEEATIPPPDGRPVGRWPTPSGVDLEISRSELRLAPSGKNVEERYRLLGEIGRGGMGRILKARDTEIGREVAVKVLLGGTQARENLIRRFWTEVQATGQLEHPSIIPIHDVGRLPTGELFYVMKMLSGRTLADIIQQLKDGDPEVTKEFTRVRLLTIFQQIAYAVAFSHAHGVVHRDIKPGNIMVGRYGESILLDWGLAKILSEDAPEITEDLPRVRMVGRYSASETASGTITGTPQYMSPEATEGRPELLTPKSDVYGLGATLYEILTLEPAFADIGFVPTVMKVRQGDFVPPREKAPELSIPLDLDELCMQAMRSDPQERPPAKKLADDIGAFLEGAKERQRRQQEAKARVRDGRRSTDRWKQLKIELQAAESEAKRLAKEVPLWAEIERKRDIWALEDRVSELEIEAIGAFEEAEADFMRALGEVPDDREARSALAALYFARFGEAERARDVEGQRYYRTLVQRYDDGVWERVLEGDGTLEVTAEPDDVEVSIARFVSVDRVLRPAERRSLGKVPVSRFEIPIGSYVLTLSRPGERDILRPVLIGRTESVTVHVKFRTSAEIGEAFLLVPEGPAILGGDTIAHGALDRKIAEVAEFGIARFPVTCDEYLAFINDLVKRAGVEEALRHVPRARAQEGYYWRYDADRERFEYPQKSPGGQSWVGNLPVNGVSMEDAEAYAAWRSELTGEALRLLHEHEWEKAARGVDGRFFPWGDHFDPTFCKMKESRNVPYPEPEPVGAFPIDCSPYGARDMAGSMREICLTDVGGSTVPVVRGGCWSDTGLFCRVAFRHITQPDFVNTGLGFRLAKDL